MGAAPTHPDIFCHRGQLHLLQNEFSQAVSDLRDAVRLDPGSVLAHVHLGMALHRNQQQAEAKSAFEKAVGLFPKSPDVLNYYGELMMELNDLDGAKAKIEKAAELGGGKFALAHVNQAVLRMNSMDMKGAMGQLQKAIAVDPLCETAHVHMAHLHIQDKNLPAAIKSYDAAINLLRVPQACAPSASATIRRHPCCQSVGSVQYHPAIPAFTTLLTRYHPLPPRTTRF